MKIPAILRMSLVAAALASMPALAFARGQAFTRASNPPDEKSFADGTRAINESNWAVAVKVFSGIASEHSALSDGALYWQAYAEDKLGQAKSAEQTCAALRSGYPASRWIEDCEALEVEIYAHAGKPVQIDPGASDEVKLLALNAMMHQDEPRALAEIQAILNGDPSDRLRKEAQFILGQHYSDVTYAEIVRISHVEGDVRIQRGEPNGKPSSAAWEQAVSGLPLETGFSLVARRSNLRTPPHFTSVKIPSSPSTICTRRAAFPSLSSLFSPARFPCTSTLMSLAKNSSCARLLTTSSPTIRTRVTRASKASPTG